MYRRYSYVTVLFIHVLYILGQMILASKKYRTNMHCIHCKLFLCTAGAETSVCVFVCACVHVSLCMCVSVRVCVCASTRFSFQTPCVGMPAIMLPVAHIVH